MCRSRPTTFSTSPITRAAAPPCRRSKDSLLSGVSALPRSTASSGRGDGATRGRPVGDRRHGLPPPFRTSDGVWVELEALDAALWQRFWTALDVPAADVSAAGGRSCALSERGGAVARLAAHHDVLHTYKELVDTASRTGMSVCPVRT